MGIGAPVLPKWVLSERLPGSVPLFASYQEILLCSESTESEAVALIPDLLRVEQILKSKTVELECTRNRANSGGSSSTCQPSRCTKSCMVRLMVGACCELYAVMKACNKIGKQQRIEMHKYSKSMLRVYNDSLLAAVWTSAHAEHAIAMQTCNFSLSSPSIHSVPCDIAEYDFSSLCTHGQNSKLLPSDSAMLFSLFSRSFSPGTRGWESSLKLAIEKSEGTKRVCINSILVALTGMHSSIHPAMRMEWKDRLVLLHTISPLINNNPFCSSMQRMCGPVRESIRRMFARCVSNSIATIHARSSFFSSFATCPLCMPSPQMEASMVAFARAGSNILSDAAANVSLDIASTVISSFKMYESGPFCPEWLPSVFPRCSSPTKNTALATSAASELWYTAFRCNFVPFWAHSQSHDIRATRLDDVQYTAIHGMNAVTALTILLSDKERMNANRLAISNVSSGIASMEESVAIMGMKHSSAMESKMKTSMSVAVALRSIGERNAARLLCFLRMASICEDIRIYDLGKKTFEMQAKALVRRMMIADVYSDLYNNSKSASELLHLLPQHATCLAACVECKRVTNASSTESNSCSTFNEIGTTSAMISEDYSTGLCNLRCAKRCSASMKSATAFEERMKEKRVESYNIEKDAINSIISNRGSNYDSGASSRSRRDSKSALSQRSSSVHCGNENMLVIPIVGKAVRIWGSWYSLCSFCGCFVKFSPHNRHGSEICCLRCDHRMLSRNSPESNDPSTTSAQCRFCGKVRRKNANSSRIVRHTNAHPYSHKSRCCGLAVRPKAHWSALATRQGADGHVWGQRKPTSPSTHRLFLSSAL